MAENITASTNGGQKAGANSVQSEQRELTPVQVANEVITQIRLRRVRFCDVAARAAIPADALPDDTRLSASTHFRRPTIDREGTGFKAASTMIFKLSGPSTSAADQVDETGPCIEVQATLEAIYSFRDDAPKFTEEQLAIFALHYCPFHVWGYWREFVHSSLARLEFPALTVPLFQIGMAQALVVDEIE